MTMEKGHTNLPDSRKELKEIVLSNREKIKRLEEENRLLRLALFAPKSEKLPVKDSPQLLLFDMPENLPEEEHIEKGDETEIGPYTRKKRGRKPLPEDLPREEIIRDIPETEKVCACGCALTRIGEEVSEKLDVIPARMRVLRVIRPQYACKACEGVEDEGPTVKIAPPQPQIIPKGLATAGLLAHILTGKFCDGLPFYRQTKQFVRLGIDIPRQSMCNWTMKAAGSCSSLLDLLEKECRSGPLINVDETTVQVLNEPDRKATQKSYMWVFRGGSKKSPVVIFQYHPSRAGKIAKDFLKKYQGVVQTDGYVGYDFLDRVDKILHVACWAHARRKFMDTKKASNSKKAGSADRAIATIRSLYRLEKKAKDEGLTPEEIYEMRQKDAKPILDEYKEWLEKRRDQVPPKTLLGKAINYNLNQWHRLENYIKDGNSGIDNNVVENAIRPFVVGRKAWLFSGTPEGAKASALLYSLIETAKANKLEPYSYLRFLFEKLPITPVNELACLLPTRLKPADLIMQDIVSGV